ncbi:NADH-quinone oxidoreductase subunit NuoE [Microbulbifer celer]|uniref:NADH-quinone oxidoreductase subunit E n=1 Tax=Microbulbifer celer TaxID=435905 RepID=A0ABW3U389_9GAMM|nr:NADH-quinone oxidoreductase subunit NuoE [Microbulbifer celer]UFN58030.1 NADH-quinone oxidoreductase subunit NuoE [Microbulbifer celer]
METITPSLSPEEILEIEQEAAHYAHKSAVALEALRIVQHHRGWVSDGSLQALADYLDYPIVELEALATYYQLIFRQPVGRHVIYCCNSASCWMLGGGALQQHLQETLNIRPGETTADEVFTLLETPCLGDCDKAPVMMVGTQMQRNLTRDKLDTLLASLRLSPGGEDAR